MTKTKRQSHGRPDRRGTAIAEFFDRFSDDKASEAWFVERHQSDGLAYPHGAHGRLRYADVAATPEPEVVTAGIPAGHPF